jgi:DNA-binding transcriptional ArsR family regulator
MRGREKEMERLLKALANGRRLLIISYLKKVREANVSEIAEEIRLSLKSTSRHLYVLFSADLVERNQRGLEVYYKLSNGIPRIIEPIVKSL